MSEPHVEDLGRALDRTRADLARATREVRELIGIGISLAAERDVERVLRLLLTKARELTWSDAGHLYLVEPDDSGGRVLRFKVLQCDSVSMPPWTHGLPIGPQSIAGYAAQGGEVINVADAYALPPGSPFRLDRTLDQTTGYRTKSMLAVPMKTPGGDVIGVLQLVNRRPGRDFRFASVKDIERDAVPFTARSQDLVMALAAQGAVAIENGRLYAELRAALVTVEESQRRVIQSERLRALGEMAGGVAHDFNNMLAVVVGRAQLLLRQIKDPVIRRQLEIIEQVGQDGAQTVRRIQEFARMRRNRPFQDVDLSRIVREVVEAARPNWDDQARARDVTYDMRLDLPEVPLLVGDPAELRESLLNLLFNALDAMPQGGRVTFTTGAADGFVWCAVEDTGVGMTEQVRQRCFEPFFTTKAEHGTGLGLSIAYGIVTRHGGEIEVRSQPGHGSRFTMRLPVAGTPAAVTPREEPTLAGVRARILVVEDEPAVREILTDLLTGRGHAVAACEDGESAVLRLQSEPFDLALLDLSMPGLSGWEVAKRMREAHPRAPIVLITGWGDQIDLAEARSRGIEHVVAKPFNLDDVALVVDGALSRADR